MTRSIFDPTGTETEHSGSRNLGPDAKEISHMPPLPADHDEEADGDDATIDMGVAEVDAPQEPEVVDDPLALMEGQPTDTSDAPQESSE